MRERKSGETKTPVRFVTVTEGEAGQRIDNFLITRLKGMPKTHVYKLIRKGEVRVNKGRISAFYKLIEGDVVRLPPVYLPDQSTQAPPSRTTQTLLSDRIIYENDYLLIINKPAGMSVHAGSTVRVGVIEALKHMYPKLPQLELAHRLDSETTGCLVVAKKKRVLRELHTLLREGKMIKIYWALTKGVWSKKDLKVEAALHKDYRDGGKHVVEVNPQGKSALTVFSPIKLFKNESLMEARLHTGRTHQIRVHAAYRGHPIAGDDRYGDELFNKEMKRVGLKRMFLHARSIDFILPSSGERIKVEAPLDPELEAVIHALGQQK